MDNGFRNASEINRRRFLSVGTRGIGGLAVGGLAIGGLTLADVLRQRACAETQSRRPKSVIMIFLSGGPSHLDMYDMKPMAPVEYRGEFQPIHTNVPGIELCELMPMQAQIADKFAILRGAQLAHQHTANMFYSGFPWEASSPVPGEARRPAVGSVISRLRPGMKDVPPYVSIDNNFEWERAYDLGAEHEPLRVGKAGDREAVDNLERHRDVPASRLTDRQNLLQDFDRVRRELELGESAIGVDRFQQRAMDIVTSSRTREAFDLDQEPKMARERYGEATLTGQLSPGVSFLLARRLIEAGVSVVTVSMRNFDTHRNNFQKMRQLLPVLDRALHALVMDLSERGLLDDVAIVMGGEFGRTPRIGDATPDGRGHWPEAGFLCLAGGGLRTGQVIGATDSRGESVIGRPINFKNVLATVYHVLGIDTATTFLDYNARPQVLLDDRDVIRGLF